MGSTPANARSNRTLALLAVIVLLGAALRLYDLASRSIWYDEGFTLALAQRIDWSFSFFNVDTTTDAPLLAILVHLWEWVLSWIPGLAPGSFAYDYLIRLIPCVFAILAVPLTFAVCRRAFEDERAALIAAFLCAISPFQIFYAQELKSYSLYLALSLASVYCLLQALETGRRGYWAGLVVCLTLCVYSHFFSAWNVLLVNLYFLLTWRRYGKHLRAWIVSQTALVLLCLPAAILAFQANAIVTRITNIYTIPPDTKSAFITFKTFFAGYGPHALVYWPLFLIAAVLFLYGLWSLRNRRQALIFAFVFVFVPIVANVIVWRMRHFPMYEHRLFIFSGAVAYGIAACGLAAGSRGYWRAGILALIAALTLPCLRDYYAHNLHPLMSHRMGVRYKVQCREAAAYVASQIKDGDVVGHSSHFTYFPFLHYLQRVPVKQHVLRLTEGELTGFLAAYPKPAIWNTYGCLPMYVQGIAPAARRLWLVESWWEPFDLNPLVINIRRWLDEHMTRTETKSFDGLTVYLYDNPAPR